jgi:chromosome segregation ATPase
MVYALEAVQNSFREINAKLNATCATVRAEREAVPPELSSMAKQHQQEIVSLKAKVAMLERDLASLQRQVSLQNLSTQLRSRSGSFGTAVRGRAPYSRAMSSRQPSSSQAMLDAEHHRIKSTFKSHFKSFSAILYKKIVFGDVYTNFDDFVFDVVYDIVEF